MSATDKSISLSAASLSATSTAQRVEIFARYDRQKHAPSTIIQKKRATTIRVVN